MKIAYANGYEGILASAASNRKANAAEKACRQASRWLPGQRYSRRQTVATPVKGIEPSDPSVFPCGAAVVIKQ
ncbi:hypothetical protein BV501_16915 [Erwinia sp. OAMSP11]|nr:hypothetical protein BV501_16915 [Erwinia sp. OAMSP11]PIJ75971.1 hypothetical protein BK416_00320 [Erwinia sp. OLSSP12]PIJ78871.1 hypothetical protein BLD47_16265 [Erwinia sp. OLCASP19]